MALCPSWSRGFSRFSDPKTRLKARLQPSKTLLETDKIALGAKYRLSKPQLSCGVEALAKSA